MLVRGREDDRKLFVAQLDRIEIEQFQAHEREHHAHGREHIHGAAAGHADGTRHPQAGGGGEAAHMVLGFHDDVAAEEAQASHDAGGHTGGVEFVGPLEAVLRKNHEQGRAQCHQHVRADSGPLGTKFPLEANQGRKASRSQQADG